MTTPTQPNDGGPAFPRPPFTPGQYHDGMKDAGFASTGHPGMSLRQYYIGQIIAGMAAGPYWSENVVDGENTLEARRGFVRAAIATADTLLEEMEK